MQIALKTPWLVLWYPWENLFFQTGEGAEVIRKRKHNLKPEQINSENSLKKQQLYFTTTYLEACLVYNLTVFYDFLLNNVRSDSINQLSQQSPEETSGLVAHFHNYLNTWRTHSCMQLWSIYSNLGKTKGNTLLNRQVFVFSFHMHLKYTLKLTLTFFFPMRMTVDQKNKKYQL